MTEPNYLHPFWTPTLTTAFAPVIEANHHGRDAILAAYQAIPDDLKIDLTSVVAAGRLPMLATSAFIVPVLSPEACADICAASDAYHWAENTTTEEEAYRMKEVVLRDADPALNDKLRSVLMTGLSPWFLMTRGRLPSTLESLQLARYDADDRAHGAPHIDRSSDFSAVINLNSGDYDGGELVIRDGLVGDFVIPQLPQGYAVIFDGQRTIHHGAPVKTGTKKILVLWAGSTNDIW